ncbi:MAG: hypothetical protein IJQ73_05700 [Kiritimatiellae bacterium]|nr:hypothetical protein [Kiritimatiellia bacterium]
MQGTVNEDVASFRLHQLERNEELMFRFHQFIRDKCFEYQNKFDRTLVFLSSGAIVLAYSLFDTANTPPLWSSLFTAILLWAATFIVSLWEYMRNIRRASLYVALFGELCIFALRQHTVEDSLKGIKSLIRQLEQDPKQAKKSKKLTKELSSFVSDIKKETKPRIETLKKCAETSFFYNEPHTVCNVILLCLWFCGCVAFARFTYLKRCTLPSTVQIEETAEVQAAPASEICISPSNGVSVASKKNEHDENALEGAEPASDSLSQTNNVVENSANDRPGGDSIGN